MVRDPVVEEARKARDGYARRFNYDLDAICRDLCEKLGKADRTVVSFSPKPVEEQIPTDS